MKKLRTLILSMLVALMALFCLVGCGEAGKYNATAYKMGDMQFDLTDSTSYVELKSDNVAIVEIDLVIGKLEGTGTWEKGQKENEVVITIDSLDYYVTVEDGTMTMEIWRTELIFEKE